MDWYTTLQKKIFEVSHKKYLSLVFQRHSLEKQQNLIMRFAIYSYCPLAFKLNCNFVKLHKVKTISCLSLFEILTSVFQLSVSNQKWIKVVVLIIYPIRPLVKYDKGPQFHSWIKNMKLIFNSFHSLNISFIFLIHSWNMGSFAIFHSWTYGIYNNIHLVLLFLKC